jgi:hypothetical protein
MTQILFLMMVAQIYVNYKIVVKIVLAMVGKPHGSQAIIHVQLFAEIK